MQIPVFRCNLVPPSERSINQGCGKFERCALRYALFIPLLPFMFMYANPRAAEIFIKLSPHSMIARNVSEW